MKPISRLTVVSAFLVFIALSANAQDLAQIDKRFTRYFEKAMPGWKHERIEPFGKSDNVLIQVWYSGHTSVKISIVPVHSANDAKEAITRFVRQDRDRKQLGDIGDEAFGWGYAQSNVVLRKGKCVIYVSVTANAPAELRLDQDERLEFERKEMQARSREFAKHAANAVDEP
jgi:hypothetical protein